MVNVPAVVPSMGVQETKEVMIAVNELGLTLLNLFADGVQFADAMALWKKIGEDETFKAQLKAAYEGWSNVSGEISHIDVAGMLSLVATQMEYIPRLLEAIGKTKATVPGA